MEKDKDDNHNEHITCIRKIMHIVKLLVDIKLLKGDKEMLQVKCIQKFRNKNNQIYGYRLQDSQGNTKDVYADQLKQAIHNQQITVLNLTLTSDNRLMDTKTVIVSEQSKNTLKDDDEIMNILCGGINKIGSIDRHIQEHCFHEVRLALPTLKKIDKKSILSEFSIINDFDNSSDFVKKLQETYKMIQKDCNNTYVVLKNTSDEVPTMFYLYIGRLRNMSVAFTKFYDYGGGVHFNCYSSKDIFNLLDILDIDLNKSSTYDW